MKPNGGNAARAAFVCGRCLRQQPRYGAVLGEPVRVSTFDASRRRTRRPLHSAASTVPAVILSAAAAYELAVALGWIGLGNEPGQGSPGAGWVLAVALVTMVAAAPMTWAKPTAPPAGEPLRLRRRDRLGGLLHEYELAA